MPRSVTWTLVGKMAAHFVAVVDNLAGMSNKNVVSVDEKCLHDLSLPWV